MRTIYLNCELIREEDGCGLWPLCKCPVLKFIAERGGTSKKQWAGWANPFNWDIYVYASVDSGSRRPALSKTIAQRIQMLCDNCQYGSMPRTR